AADGTDDPFGRCDVAFSCAMIQASCAARPMWLRPAAASTALPPMCSESKLVLTMPTIGLGAGGPEVVGRNVELFHHEQPSTRPTHDFWGIRIAVTCRDRFWTAASSFSVIAAPAVSTSMMPSLPIDATTLLPPAVSSQMLPLIGRIRTSLFPGFPGFAGAGCWARGDVCKDSAATTTRTSTNGARVSLIPTSNLN